MQFSLLPPNQSLPKYTVSWKPHLRLLTGTGRGPTCVRKFITLAHEFLNHGSCRKLWCLAERNKIFISGPNNVFIGSHSLSPIASTFMDIVLFSLPACFSSALLLPAAPSQPERRMRHDPHYSRIWQNPTLVNLSMKINWKSSPGEGGRICIFYFCPPGSIGVAQVPDGRGEALFYLPWNIWKKCENPSVKTISQ